jgi:hypothetical protein
MMTPLSHPLPALPGFSAPQSYAAWPVWSDSTTKPIRFQPMPKKAAVKLWHRARDFDRGTHQAGKHGGAVGPTALAVLHALIFDFLNHRTGRLDPSYAAIAHKAGVCVRTVATALQRLRELGILNWVRRCAESWRDGLFVLEQETNAYAVLPDTQWRGYRPPQEPPAPAPSTWAIHRPCRLCSPRRLRRVGTGAVCYRWCRSWQPIPRTGWRLPWRGSGGRSWRATREFYRSAAAAEKPPRLKKHLSNTGGRSPRPTGQQKGRRS